MPPLILSANDSTYTNDVTLSDAPAVWMTGDRIRFINSASGRVITTTAGIAAIRMAGADGVVVNEAGGIIRSDISGAPQLVIEGSAGADRVENAGAIIGIVALGEGIDTYVSRVTTNDFAALIDLGIGDDFFYVRPSASVKVAPIVDGGDGQDRYVIFESDGDVDGSQADNVEILDLRTNGFVESFSGLDTIVVDFRAAGRVFNALRFFDTPDADVQILAETGSGNLSIYDQSAIGSLTGSAFGDSIDLGNDTLVSGRIDLGGGNDFLNIRRSQFENPQQVSIGEEIDGGAGIDSLSVHLQAGDIFDAANVVNFERMRVSTSAPLPAPLLIRNVDHIAQLVIAQFFSGPVRVEASDLSTGSILVEPTGSLTISADSVVGLVNSLTPVDTVLSDVTKSISILNEGQILGEVRMYIGDDVFDSRAGTVGGRIFGFTGNDTIWTDAGVNLIDGGAGADFLSAGAGNDSLFGGSGADVLVGGAGADRLDGNADIDTVSFEGDAGAVSVNLLNGLGFGNAAEGDIYVDIENVIGSLADDWLIGSNGANRLDGSGGDDILFGGAGADQLIGGAGIDTASYEQAGAAIFVNLRTGFGFLNAQGDTYNGIENVIGSTAGDFLIGDDGVNRLDGSGGNDILLGGLGGDELIGGLGSDTASYEDNWGPVSVNLKAGIGAGNAAQGDLYQSIENLTGGVFNDSFIGDDAANRIDGGGGDDLLFGGLGGDVLIGGTGIDTASYAGDAGAVSVNLRSGQGLGNAAQGDTYSGIENVIGSTAADFLIGGDGVNRIDGAGGDDILVGGLGGDVLIGGSGSDTASYEDNWGSVFVNLRAGVGSGNAAQGDVYQSIENLTGGLFADFFVGDDGVNRIDGGGGDDILLGGLGGDLLIGGTGSNTASYEDNWGPVFVNLTTGQGFNNAAEGDSYQQIQNLTGGLFNDFFIGDANANRFAGGSGNDNLIGAGGADIFVFDTAPGAGNVDTVGDFVSGTDKIALDDAVFAGIGALGALNPNAFFAGTAAHDADDRIVYDAATGNLYFDADGNGAGAQVLFATLQGTPAIAANDFTVI